MLFETKNKGRKEIIFTQDLEFNGLRCKDLDYILPYGQVKGKEWIFNHIRMVYLETNFTDLIELNLKIKGKIVIMYFNFKGKFSTTDVKTGKSFDISDNQNNIYYGNNVESIFKIPELQTKFFFIQLSQESFLKILQNGGNIFNCFINTITNNTFTVFSDSNPDINFLIQQCINAILNCSLEDSLKVLFLYSKTLELLVLQAETFINAVQYQPVFLKKEYDKERILFARDYLLKNLDAPPTLPELSRIIGINEYKLKKGFKEMFNFTVFQYLAEVRLELAKNYLLENKKSISEIAFELGYSSLQHFSFAFKKKFGVSPNQVK